MHYYHPLHLYRYQVLKQADAVLAYYLYEIEAADIDGASRVQTLFHIKMPMIIIFILAQKQIMDGMVDGAVK